MNSFNRFNEFKQYIEERQRLNEHLSGIIGNSIFEILNEIMYTTKRQFQKDFNLDEFQLEAVSDFIADGYIDVIQHDKQIRINEIESLWELLYK